MRHRLLLLSVVFAIKLSGQVNEPFTIQGQLTNSPEKELYLFIDGDMGEVFVDTLRLDDQGRFYLRTYSVTFPQKANIQKNATQINEIYVAPGYDLTIYGDASDFFTLLKTSKISGKGSESNRYRELFYAEMIARNDTVGWFSLPENELIAYIDQLQQLTDSLEKVAFSAVENDDPYFSYFADLTHLNNRFNYEGMKFSYLEINSFDAVKANAFIDRYIDKRLLEDINNETYYKSNQYRNSFISSYVGYLIKQDYQKNPTLAADLIYPIKKIDSLLKGKIRDDQLYRKIISAITFKANDFAYLTQYREKIKPFLYSIDNTYYRQHIENVFIEKEKTLFNTQKGKPAPEFALKSSREETYRLTDFRGKVLYIDFWASWCRPCREEMPELKKLFEKYKNEERLSIIGISVNDGEKEWLTALRKDSPGWLQLHDADNLVSRSYNVHTIPRYILIDQQGNIVDFDAPRPSDYEQLIGVIDRLLNQTF